MLHLKKNKHFLWQSVLIHLQVIVHWQDIYIYYISLKFHLSRYHCCVSTYFVGNYVLIYYIQYKCNHEGYFGHSWNVTKVKCLLALFYTDSKLFLSSRCTELWLHKKLQNVWSEKWPTKHLCSLAYSLWVLLMIQTWIVCTLFIQTMYFSK